MQLVLERNFGKFISEEYRCFAEAKSQCKACEVFKHYKQVGQSEGNAVNPTYMFIGEALGKEETEEIRPFIGKAGQRIRNEIRKHNSILNKSTALISNVLCCRPLDNVFPTKGKTVDGEVEDIASYCSNKWLKTEIEIVRPKVIVALGNKAMNYVWSLGGHKFSGSITDNRGKWVYLEKFDAVSIATFHPAYVLRCANIKDSTVSDTFELDIECASEKGIEAYNSMSHRNNANRDIFVEQLKKHGVV